MEKDNLSQEQDRLQRALRALAQDGARRVAALEQENIALKVVGDGQGEVHVALTAAQSEIKELQKSLYYYKKRTKDLKKELKSSGGSNIGSRGSAGGGSSSSNSTSRRPPAGSRDARSPGGTVRKTADDYYTRGKSAPEQRGGGGGGGSTGAGGKERGRGDSSIPRRAKTASSVGAAGATVSGRLDFGQTYSKQVPAVGARESGSGGGLVRGDRKGTYVVGTMPKRKGTYTVGVGGDRGGEAPREASGWTPTDAAGVAMTSGSTVSTSATSATTTSSSTTTATSTITSTSGASVTAAAAATSGSTVTAAEAAEATLDAALGLEASEEGEGDSLVDGAAADDGGYPTSPASLVDSIDGRGPF